LLVSETKKNHNNKNKKKKEKKKKEQGVNKSHKRAFE